MKRAQQPVYQVKGMFPSRIMIFLLVFFTAALLVGGYLYFVYEKNTIHYEKLENLKAIASLKSEQIRNWKKERMSEAVFFSNNPAFVENIKRLLAEGDDAGARFYFHNRLSHIQETHKYENIFILSTDGELLLSLEPEYRGMDDVMLRFADSALIHERIILSDFYECQTHDCIHLDFHAPVRDLEGRPVGVTVFRIDPQHFLYPLIQSWPAVSHTSETYLVRKEGDSVLFLNELKHRSNTAMHLKVSLSDSASPAVQAVLGREGLCEGMDYRGKKVLAGIHAIEGTPWFMVAKIDNTELYSDLRYKTVVIILFVIILIVLTALGLAWGYHYRQRNMYRGLYLKTKQLWESREEFRTTLYSIGDGVITTDNEGHVRQMNPVAEQLTGWKEKDAFGAALHKVFRIVDEEKGNHVENPAETVIREGRIVGLANHTILINKNGKKIPISDSGAPIRGRDGKIIGVVLVFSDQTGQREMQQKLKASAEKFRLIAENSIDVIWQMDLRLKFTYVSPSIYNLTGYTQEEWNGTNLWEHTRWLEFAKMAREALKTIHNFKTRGKVFLVGNILAKDKTEIPVEIVGKPLMDKDGKLVGLQGSTRDITERVIREERLLKFSKAVEQSPVSIVITDKNGKIEYVNPKFTRLTGYNLEEIIGRTPNILQSGRHDEKFYKDLWDTVCSGKNWQGEFCNQKKNGEHYWEQAVISPLKNERGEITHLVGLKEDITEKKMVFDELIKTKVKAEEGDRLKTAFLANMSHEVRTPMNAIMGFSDLLKDEISSEERNKFVEIINTNASQLLKILDDVMEISRLETEKISLDRVSFSVSTLFLDLYNSFKKGFQDKNVYFSYVVPDEFSIKGDYNKIRQIISGLISNALKYTKKGRVSFGCQRYQNAIEFFVEDTGIGVLPEEKDMIFDRFFRGMKAQAMAIRGTGLGLSIAKSLVDLMDGNIGVQSTPGKGSRFHFSIPYEEVGNMPAISKKPLQSDLNSMRILIAEDDEDSYKYLEALLKPMVKNIDRARTGGESIQLAQDNYYDVILMDIKMPLMDGLTATKKIKDKHKDIVVIAQTAYAQPEEKIRALEAGCDDYLVKPVRKETLVQILGQYIF